MIILSHSGKQHAYQVANVLNNLNELSKFYTSGYVTNQLIQNWAIQNQNTFWTRRFHRELPIDKVQSNWRFELKEQLLIRLYGAGEQVQNAVFQRDEAFDRFMSRKLQKHHFTTFWGFQGSCLNSLKSANQLGKMSVCELATAHVTAANQILKEEQQLHPEWADSIDNLNFPKNYEERLENEPHVAQKVIAASQFTRQTLLDADVDQNKIIQLPLGFDHQAIPFDENSIIPYNNRPLKLLYAGRVTQRKGIKYLMEAVKSIGHTNEISLDLIGYTHGSGEGLKPYKGYYNQFAPLSQNELFQKYAEYDALVLPSVFEGFGLVIVEAMAAGLPVITTPNTMGPDIIQNDLNGYVVPIRDVTTLAEAISSLANKSSEEMHEMKLQAYKSALQFTWKAYETRLQSVLPKITNHA